MSVERLRRVNALFDAALALDEAARVPFLARECADDAGLLAELTRLLEREKALEGSSTQSAVGLFAAGLESAAADDARRHAFGPYRLGEEIGSGGMGRVFRARRVDGVVEQEVAIKLVRRELLHPALLRRFSTERQVLAALDHPGISRLLDAGETGDGTPYVVMELVRGEPLLEFCDRRRLSVPQRLALFRRILDAVAHAHRNLVVHRDLKPGNVLVTEDGQPKLLDFGIAKPLAASGDATATAERFFTPAYAAPEQLRGGPTTVGCDVYSLGALLFELLAGRPPFLTGNATPGEIERMIVSVPPPAMSATIATGDLERARARALRDTRQLRRQLGGDLEAIVQRALRKEPAARYATVEQFDADLQAYLEHRPVAASGRQFGYRLRKFVARHRLPLGLAAVAAAAVVGGAVLLILQNIALVHERDRARYALDFLQQSFVAADPARAAGGDVTARMILDGARRQLDEVAATRPLLYAELGDSIASVQLSLGMSPEAAELAERVVEAARRGDAPRAQQYDLLVLQAKALTNAGEPKRGQAVLDEASQLVAEPSPDWILARSRILVIQGKPKEALPLLRGVLADVAHDPPTDEFATRVRWQLAEALRLDSDYEASLQVLDEMLAWQRAALPPGHTRELLTRMKQVDVLRRLERYDEALSEAGAVAGEVERRYGSGSALAAYARTAFGSALWERDQVVAAAEQYRLAVDAWRRSLGATHPSTIRTTYNLAALLADMEPPHAEAEPLFRKVMHDGLNYFGPRTNATVLFRLGLAGLLSKTGRAPEALRLLTEPAGLEGYAIASESNRTRYRELLAIAVRDNPCDAPGRENALRSACGAARELLAAAP